MESKFNKINDEILFQLFDEYRTTYRIPSLEILKQIILECKKDRIFSLEDSLNIINYISSNRQFLSESYITPRGIVDLMINLINIPNNSIVLDPTCGIGSHLLKVSHKNPKTKKYGIDINKEIITIAKLLCPEEENITYLNADTLKNYPNKIPKADILFADIPWGLRVKENIADNFKFPSRFSEILFIQRFLEVTKDKGILCLVLPDGFLFKESTEYLKLRNYIRDNHHLSAVISLSPTSFAPRAGVKTSIVIINKNHSKEPTFFGTIDDLEDFFSTNQLIEIYNKRKSIIHDKYFWVEKNNIENRWDYSFYDPKNKIIETKAKELKYDLVLLTEIAEIISPKSSLKQKDGWHYPVFKGDILFATDGTIGRPVLISQDKKIYKSKTKYAIIRLKNKLINPIFLITYIKSKYFHLQIEQFKTGTFINHLSIKSLNNFKIIVPPLNQQKEVTDELALTYSIIESNLEKIETLAQSIKNRLEQEMFNIEDVSDSFKDFFKNVKDKILSSYPFPISYIYRDLTLGRTNKLEKFNRLLDLYEIILKLTAVLYFSNTKVLNIDIKKIIEKTRMQKPFLGNWLNLLKESRQKVKETEMSYPFDKFNVEDFELFYELNDLRNNTRGHGATLTEDLYERYLNEYLPRIEGLLTKITYTSTGKIFYSKFMEENDEGFLIKGILLEGDHPILTDKIIKRKDSLKTKRLYFIENSTGIAYSLHPWIIYEHCPECHEKEILFFDLLKDEPFYLGYKHGWKPNFGNYTEAIKNELFIID